MRTYSQEVISQIELYQKIQPDLPLPNILSDLLIDYAFELLISNEIDHLKKIFTILNESNEYFLFLRLSTRIMSIENAQYQAQSLTNDIKPNLKRFRS